MWQSHVKVLSTMFVPVTETLNSDGTTSLKYHYDLADGDHTVASQNSEHLTHCTGCLSIDKAFVIDQQTKEAQ